MEGDLRDQVEQICRQILAPLVVADGGEMYLGKVTPDSVLIHLAGSCAGCPGASFTSERLIQPTIKTVAPRAHIVVTAGWIVPDGWTRVS